jgi:peptidoglycan/xylan/chitin deacetylase (PgdA/CDA1 family)
VTEYNMNIIIILKSVLAKIYHYSGINAWKLKKHSKNEAAILMYHRVIPIDETGNGVQPGMVVAPNTLESHIKYLRKYFNVVPLTELISIQNTRKREESTKPLCVLTFDDGWYDFYKYAYPILRKYETPATVFLPTDYIGTDRWFWTDRIGIILDRLSKSLKSPEIDLMLKTYPILLKEITDKTSSYEQKLESVITHLKAYRVDEIEQIITALSIAYGIETKLSSRVFLSWEEVQEMYQSGIVSFGSHTAGHPLLTTLTEEQIRHELRKSKDALIHHKVVDTSFITFSYPNGNYTKEISHLVAEAGYHLAVTTTYGWNEPGENMYTFKRISVHQDMASTEAMLESRIVNML